MTALADAHGFPNSLLLAGAGKMGGAMLDGWLDTGVEPRRITVVDPHAPDDILTALSRRGVTVNPHPHEVHPPAMLVLAIKPQALEGAAPTLATFAGRDTLLLSIVAGKTMADLARAFPNAQAFARAMPNTPAAVRRGITGVAAGASVSEAQRIAIDTVLAAVGAVEWLPDEGLIDAVTAVSGSGPAYVFYMTECLAKAGETAGLPPATALRLARATVEGAGALMVASPSVSPEALRRNVTSPGGTTAAALEVLMTDGRLLDTMTAAVAAARRRAGELAG